MVAPPLLALAEVRRVSGPDLLLAFILGQEVQARIGLAISPNHYSQGWHITSTCGVFGAAAACAKLLELSADQISNAIGIAASQSAGIVENLPSAAKNVSVGNAARNGLFAALLTVAVVVVLSRRYASAGGRVAVITATAGTALVACAAALAGRISAQGGARQRVSSSGFRPGYSIRYRS